MSDAVKFTEEEMKKINDLQQTYVNLQNALGQFSISEIRLNQQLSDLSDAKENVENQFVETQTKEKNFVDSINKKYGDGNLNLESGEFTPKLIEKN